MTGTPREFGLPVAGATYLLRPGGYAVIFRAREVAVLMTPAGGFLPGGGAERGETPEQAALREAREECGMQLRIVGTIGTADQLVHAAGEATGFRKRCTFFLAEPASEKLGDGEADHVLTWLSPEEAGARLQHESQRWAVAEACRATGR